MNRSETAVLLALAAAYDRRTVGEADVMAWADVLDDIRLADAQTAVKNHYRNSREFLMPFDVRQGVRAIRDERLRTTIMPAPPPELDPMAYKAWLRDMTRAIADGTYQQPALEQGDPDAVKAFISGAFRQIPA